MRPLSGQAGHVDRGLLAARGQDLGVELAHCLLVDVAEAATEICGQVVERDGDGCLVVVVLV